MALIIILPLLAIVGIALLIKRSRKQSSLEEQRHIRDLEQQVQDLEQRVK